MTKASSSDVSFGCCCCNRSRGRTERERERKRRGGESFASIHRGGVLVAPKTERQKHFCTHRAHRKRAQKSSRDHPSVPPTRASGPFSRVPFETAVSSLSIASKKRRETRARAHSPPKLSLHIAVVFRAHFPKRNLKKKTREICPPTRRRDLHFHHSRTTAFRRARTKAKNETTTTNGKREKRVLV